MDNIKFENLGPKQLLSTAAKDVSQKLLGPKVYDQLEKTWKGAMAGSGGDYLASAGFILTQGAPDFLRESVAQAGIAHGATSVDVQKLANNLPKEGIGEGVDLAITGGAGFLGYWATAALTGSRSQLINFAGGMATAAIVNSVIR